jgi:hypothetical protein
LLAFSSRLNYFRIERFILIMAHLVKKVGLDALADDPFTDFKVVCGSKKRSVHRTYLCGDSEILMKHCTEMKVSIVELFLDSSVNMFRKGNRDSLTSGRTNLKSSSDS